MRHELLYVGKLIGGPMGEVDRFLKTFVATPATAVANQYFASAAMHNGAYTVANGGLPGDGLAHNVTVAETAVDVEDTNGTITFTGYDNDNNVISEVITPDAGVTIQGAKAFKQVLSATGAGWVQGGTGADTIVIGFGEVVGLPDKLAVAGDVLMVAHNTALVNAPTVTVDPAELSKNTVLVPTGDGTKKLRVLYQV